jgi:hypothetical protein
MSRWKSPSAQRNRNTGVNLERGGFPTLTPKPPLSQFERIKMKGKHSMKKRTTRQPICTPQGERLLFVKEAAQVFNISYNELVIMVRQGDIVPYAHIGAMVLVKEDDIKALRI